MKFNILALLALFVLLPRDVKADVVITRLEPPLAVGVPDEDDFWVTQGFIFGGQTNVFLGWGIEEMDLGFFAPSQVFIVSAPLPPGRTNVYGGVAALPFGTIIGSNVVSSANLNGDTWYGGDLVTGGDTSLGDRADMVGDFLSDEIIGDPPVVSGDAVGKEGVIALEVYLNGQPHFAYIHFDFRYIYQWAAGTGFGGYIEGYAYETQPGVPITAERLNDSTPTSDGLIAGFNRFNGFVLTWNAVNGGTYRVQSSTNLVTWTTASGNILANQNSVTFTIPASSVSQCFYRIQRVN